MTIIGETIARLRRERGMTQEALAESMGVSSQTISKWENSTTCPDVSLLPVLADFFGVSVDDLYG
ncbi:MAG: helix-turn-helix transcriptional regulator, partial [Clostridia bacterium]|nr:helix-turn-helix transcriptional regulator [Clostridia bacterium]